MRYVLVLALLLFQASGALAQERIPSHCVALAELSPQVHFVSLEALPPDTVGLHYIAHASFLLRTGTVNIVTDFTGFIGTTRMIPDVVTMNHAHDSHWTGAPDPAIPHVLPGWGDFGQGIEHRLDLGEVLIRNVSTDIRSQFSGIEPRGNSIFVFEAAGLCIGHLGHLHHEPDDAQYAALGRLDVVMAPVDGGYTLDLPTMIRVLKRLRASVVIPMHWFSDYALQEFLAGMADEFTVVELEGPYLEMSMDRLPSRPTVMVLRPEWLREPQ